MIALKEDSLAMESERSGRETLPRFPFLRHLNLLVAMAVVLALLGGQALEAASAPAVKGTGGAVASEHEEATQAGLDVLRAGGNAVDAAVATALALAVVYPEAGNLGGGGFAVVKMGDELASLDFREVAPGAATDDMYLDDTGEPISEASRVGPLAAGVPGSPQGLFDLHRRFGTLPWATVVEPARRLATQGFRVDSHLANLIERKRQLFERFPETARVWLPNGQPPEVGSLLRLPDLAATLKTYAQGGPKALAEGSVAAAVEEVSRRHGGVLEAKDLANYKAVWREPIRFEVFGWQGAAMSLPSSGGIILAQASELLERIGWKDLPRFGSRRHHLLAEVLRQAFADRYLMGDPETTAAQPGDLLSEAALVQRLKRVRVDAATPSQDLHPDPVTLPKEAADTTHLSVVDAKGNLVALTTTLNGLFGCGLYVPGAGFFLNNEMDDFAAAPGRPNMFGLVQGEANKVRPGRRMLSSMSPTIVWRSSGAGSESMALGGRGGSRIPTNTLQVLLNVLVDGDPLQTAIDRPRIHHQWLPDRLEAEMDTLSPETQEALKALGHKIHLKPAGSKIQAVRRTPDGQTEAANDPRSKAAAGVVNPGL
ncbi:MAG: gamma-glutamyltransferase [Deltaproteobacteria bacterium]|nr:gamma-glutamyltransferase [Deltaproteobacteria bacterium]